jgi:outer membrane lipoprotein SlyB
MSQHSRFVSILILSALCAGCVGTGPNTQQGAVTGGAIGALTGAIIGNNSGGRNGFAGALIGGTIGAIAGGTIGNSIDNERNTLYTSEYQATTRVVVQQPPPPSPPAQPEVVVMQPRPDAIWIPGYWDFNGVQYVWIGGFWAIPPPYHHQYMAAHWANRGGSWVYIHAYWR